ncbi:MAG: amino acid ABC transporter permease [Pygmaiobacter sp.]
MERGFWGWVVFILDEYGGMFLKGAGTTLYVAIIGTLAGLAIGLIIGTVRTIPMNKSDSAVKKIGLKLVNILLSIYIEVFRGTPMIVQAMILYYGSAEAFGWDLSTPVAALLIVSINTGAYMSEIVRGGISAVDKGQFEAAQALGMTHWAIMVKIVLPQAIRNILPATGNEFVINIKDTSVLNVIALTELFYMAKTVKGALFRTYEPFLIVAAIYLVLTFTITQILRMIEKKMDGPDSYTIFGSGSAPHNAGVKMPMRTKGDF